MAGPTLGRPLWNFVVSSRERKREKKNTVFLYRDSWCQYTISVDWFMLKHKWVFQVLQWGLNQVKRKSRQVWDVWIGIRLHSKVRCFLRRLLNVCRLILVSLEYNGSEFHFEEWWKKKLKRDTWLPTYIIWLVRLFHLKTAVGNFKVLWKAFLVFLRYWNRNTRDFNSISCFIPIIFFFLPDHSTI